VQNITFLICSNGLGHFRRSLRVAHALLRANGGVRADLLVTGRQLEITRGWPILEDLRKEERATLIPTGPNIEWKKEAGAYDRASLFGWLDRLPPAAVEGADLLVSDNLGLILERRPDALLMGSFLWSEVLMHHFSRSAAVSEFHEREVELLRTHRPPMICLREMAMPYVQRYAKPLAVDWITETEPAGRPRDAIRRILITGGATDTIRESMRQVSGLLLPGNGQAAYTLLAPRRLLRDFADLPVRPFDFSPEEFRQLDLMICRPGIGALTDAVTYGIPLITIGGEQNYEIQFNARRAEQLGFGRDASGREDRIPLLIEQLNHKSTYQEQCDALLRAPKGGMQQIVQFLLNKCKQDV